LGIDTRDYMEFGSDLLSKDHRNWVAFRNGDFVSPDVISLNEKCYSTESEQLLETNDSCKVIGEKVKSELQMSDEVVYKDLLRFYKPTGYTPINPDDYGYLGPKGNKGSVTP
jgi:lipoteichoic acid synthase